MVEVDADAETSQAPASTDTLAFCSELAISLSVLCAAFVSVPYFLIFTASLMWLDTRLGLNSIVTSLVDGARENPASPAENDSENSPPVPQRPSVPLVAAQRTANTSERDSSDLPSYEDLEISDLLSKVSELQTKLSDSQTHCQSLEQSLAAARDDRERILKRCEDLEMRLVIMITTESNSKEKKMTGGQATRPQGVKEPIKFQIYEESKEYETTLLLPRYPTVGEVKQAIANFFGRSTSGMVLKRRIAILENKIYYLVLNSKKKERFCNAKGNMMSDFHFFEVRFLTEDVELFHVHPTKFNVIYVLKEETAVL